MEVTVRKSALGPHVLLESFERAPCHRRGKAEARQRFQRGEIRQRAAQQRGGKERVAQHHRARVHRQPLGQTGGRHRLLSRFFLAARVARAQGGHRIARQHHIRAFHQRRGIQLVLIVFQQNAARAGRHLHTAHAGNRGQLPGYVHARVKQKAQPFNPKAEPPGRLLAICPFIQSLFDSLRSIFHPSLACGSLRISRRRTTCSNCFSSASSGLISLAISSPVSTTISTQRRIWRLLVVCAS